MDKSVAYGLLLRRAVSIVLVAGFAFVLTRIGITAEPLASITVVVALVTAVLCLFYMEMAGMVLIAMMTFSPELSLGSLPSRDVTIRFDDVIIAIMVLAWLLKTIANRDLKLVKDTPLNAPIMAYAVALVFATLSGVAAGYVKGTEALVYLLKYMEYFMVYFLFVNIAGGLRQINRFMLIFSIVAFAGCMWGVYEFATGVIRISLPFEGIRGEANTYGGYLLLVLGLSLCMAIETPSFFGKIFYSVASVGIITLVGFTYSRASYLGMIAVIAGLIYSSRSHKRLVLLLAIGCAFMAAPLVIPETIVDRAGLSFRGIDTVEVSPGVRVNKSDSSYLKYEATVNLFNGWKQSPMLGRGVTGFGLVDTQYPKVLGEAGLIGLSAFAWMLFMVYIVYKRALRAVEIAGEAIGWHWRAIVMGYLCSFAGILVHALGANTFIIVRIIEPFWFLTAMIAMLPSAIEQELSAPRGG